VAENTVKVDISFQSLLSTISLLRISEKHQTLEFFESELFPDYEDSTEDIAEVRAACNYYQAGGYTTVDRYMAERDNRSEMNYTIITPKSVQNS
jgi:hypothetical protein